MFALSKRIFFTIIDIWLLMRVPMSHFFLEFTAPYFFQVFYFFDHHYLSGYPFSEWIKRCKNMSFLYVITSVHGQIPVSAMILKYGVLLLSLETVHRISPVFCLGVMPHQVPIPCIYDSLSFKYQLSDSSHPPKGFNVDHLKRQETPLIPDSLNRWFVGFQISTFWLEPSS